MEAAAVAEGFAKLDSVSSGFTGPAIIVREQADWTVERSAGVEAEVAVNHSTRPVAASQANSIIYEFAIAFANWPLVTEKLVWCLRYWSIAINYLEAQYFRVDFAVEI